jgi:hypothetical protein
MGRGNGPGKVRPLPAGDPVSACMMFTQTPSAEQSGARGDPCPLLGGSEGPPRGAGGQSKDLPRNASKCLGVHEQNDAG